MIVGMVQDAPGHTTILSNFRGINYFNMSYVDDPKVEEVYQQIEPNIIWNHYRVFELNREITPYAMEQAWVIPLPLAYSYNFWQPWFKNYNGVRSSGFNTYGFLKYP